MILIKHALCKPFPRSSVKAILAVNCLIFQMNKTLQYLQVAEKRKKMLDDLAIRYQKDCDKNREDMLAMEDRYEEELKTLRISLDTEKVNKYRR